MLCDGKCRAKDCVRLLKDFCVYGSIFFCCIIFLCVYAAFIDLRNVTFLSHKVKGFCFIRFKERYIHPVLYYFMKLTAFFIWQVNFVWIFFIVILGYYSMLIVSYLSLLGFFKNGSKIECCILYQEDLYNIIVFRISLIYIKWLFRYIHVVTMLWGHWLDVKVWYPWQLLVVYCQVLS